MTEIENQEVDTVDTDIDTVENGTTSDSTDVELTTDDYYKEKSSREKAENNYVKPAKKLFKRFWVKSFEELEAKLDRKPAEVEDLVNATLKEREFYANNPDLLDYKEEINNYKAKGLSLEEAKTLLMNNDKVLEARQRLQESKLSTWENGWIWKRYFSEDEVAKMSQKEYEQFRDLLDKGEVRLK